MIIYFSGSTRNIKHDITIYRAIMHAIRTLGHSIATDWVETTWLQETQHAKEELDWIDWGIVREAAIGIERSELMIAEASGGSVFGVGFEVAQALQKGKPTLLLVKEGLESKSYATGLRHDLITYKLYNDKNLHKVVETFIRENTVKTKDLRFNFVIDRQIHNHLRLRAFRTGKTKAEILRDLLLRDMEAEQ